MSIFLIKILGFTSENFRKYNHGNILLFIMIINEIFLKMADDTFPDTIVPFFFMKMRATRITCTIYYIRLYEKCIEKIGENYNTI